MASAQFTQTTPLKKIIQTYTDWETATTEFSERNDRLVATIAMKTALSTGKPLVPLFLAGQDGMYKAIQKFDGELGYKFTTYATWWIHQSIIRELGNHSAIKIPSYLKDQLRQITLQNSTTTTMSETIDNLDINQKTKEKLKQGNSTIISLSQPLNNQTQSLLGDTLEKKSNCTRHTRTELRTQRNTYSSTRYPPHHSKKSSQT